MKEVPALTALASVISDTRKETIVKAQTVPMATSPAKPVELAPIKSLPLVETENPPASTAVITTVDAPTDPTIKTSNPMPTKSGDQYFPIIIPSGQPTTPTDPNAPTPEQKTNRTMMWGFGAICFLILVIWLLNRKPA